MNKQEAKDELKELQQLLSILESKGILIGDIVKSRLVELENKLILFINQ